MKKLYKLTASNPGDLNYIRNVSNLVFENYTGNLHNWDLKDSKKIWKIHFGGRAGVLGIKLEGRECCVKLFYDNQIKSIFRNVLGYPKALRAYKKALKLSSRNISIPQIFGWAQNDCFGIALIVTELVKDSIQVDSWIKTNKPTNEFINSFASFIRNMHDAGIRHLDLSPRNILVGGGNKTGNFKFLLIDYEDARFYKKLSFRKRLLDLYHLNERLISLLSEKEREDFLKRYLDKESSEYDQWDKALRNIMQKNPPRYTKDI